MKRLIIINGPAGVGKSTVGNLLHQQIKPSFLLSGDEIRRSINDYHDMPREGRNLRNKIVLSMLDVLLNEDMTVIVVQLHTDEKMLDKYIDSGIKHNANINEYFLWVTNKDELIKRHKQRTRVPNTSLDISRVLKYWDKMKHFTISRNKNSTIFTDNQSPQETTDQLINSLTK